MPALALEELAQAIRASRTRGRDAVNAFLSAASYGDADDLTDAFRRLDEAGGWRTAFRRASRMPVPERVKLAFLQCWIDGGDSIRDSVNDDLVLKAALRALLPAYNGPDLVLYRGDSAWNRQRRTYGLSWTAEQDVADSFAKGIWRTFKGGSVVLRAEVPAAAIICAPHLLGDDYGEAEYLVDRRMVRRATVLRRHAQTAMR